MPRIPAELLVGTAYGLAVGSLVATGVGAAAVVFRHLANRRVRPVVGTAIGLVLGGGVVATLGLVDAAAVVGTDLDGVGPQAPRLVIACTVVGLISLYATSLGTRIGAELPAASGLPVERGSPLAADAVDAVDALGRVTLRPAGRIGTIDGYPPVPPALRRTVENGAWRLPADLPLAELESRLERRLETDYDLAAVSVAVDRGGRATIAAAPPTTGVAGDVPDGWRAVSVSTTIPTGLAPGDDVDVLTGSASVSGTVLAVGTTGDRPAAADGSSSADADSNPHRRLRPNGRAPRGGVGRVTVSVPAADVDALRNPGAVRLVARAGEPSHDADAVWMLERTGSVVRHVTLDPSTIEAIESEEAELLAVADGTGNDVDETGESGGGVRDRTSSVDAVSGIDWQFRPTDRDLEPGAEAFVAVDARRIESLPALPADTLAEADE